MDQKKNEVVSNSVLRVLDKGYVRLRRIMADIEEDGSLTAVNDLAPIQDAKVSFNKEAKSYGKREQRLTKFLGREGHSSPFRGCVVQFEISAPMFVRNQWYKYLIGSHHEDAPGRDPFFQHNELSRRYVEEEPEFYIPTEWRAAPENKKQGSGELLGPKDWVEEMFGMDSVEKVQTFWLSQMEDHTYFCLNRYKTALDHGVAAEQARLFLPAYAMYTKWRWTASLQAVCHFLRQRLAPDSQAEIREYAQAVRQLVEPLFPVSMEALLDAADEVKNKR